MKITCHSCAAKYTVSDEKVQGKTVKMKCRKCGATIVVGGAPHPGEAASDDAPMSVAGVEGSPDGGDLPAGSFLVNVNDGDQRTMTLAEIVAAHRSGVVNGDTYIWADGMADWQPLSDNAAISGALNGGGNGSAAYASTPVPAPLAAAAPTPSPARSESNRPAARRDSGRRNGDLFSSGMSDGAGLSSASVGQAGRRDENSVLFSLSSLTSAAPAPARSQTSATKEDSGLIDLKALAAAAPSAPNTAPAAVDTIGLFPLGPPVLTPAPVAALSPVSMSEPQKKSSIVLPMVLGVLLIGAVAVAVFLAVRGSPQAPTASPTQAAQQTAGPVEAQQNTASAPAQTAAPDVTSTAVASATSSAKVPIHGPIGVGVLPHVNNPPPSTGAGVAPPPPPPVHPAGGGCACPPGDLMCAMQKCAGKH